MVSRFVVEDAMMTHNAHGASQMYDAWHVCTLKYDTCLES